jgi:hypothetical protein
MRYAITLLLLLTACSQTEVLGCPEVRAWSQQDQSELLQEQYDVEKTHPMIKRAMTELYNMRVESRPCALLSRGVPK